MRLISQILFFFLLVSLPMTGSSQKKQITIRITQDERAYALDKYETVIRLEKEGFKIQVLLSNIAGVYSFAGFTDSICCRVGEMDTIPNFYHLPDITMAEPDFNKEKELLVGEKDCSYWYYDRTINTHRFNKKVVMLDSNKFVGVKSVKQVYFVPQQKTIKLKDLDTPLWLFFVAVDEFDSAGMPKKELMRRKVKIEWIDDDD